MTGREGQSHRRLHGASTDNLDGRCPSKREGKAGEGKARTEALGAENGPLKPDS